MKEDVVEGIVEIVTGVTLHIKGSTLTREDCPELTSSASSAVACYASRYSVLCALRTLCWGGADIAAFICKQGMPLCSLHSSFAYQKFQVCLMLDTANSSCPSFALRHITSNKVAATAACIS